MNEHKPIHLANTTTNQRLRFYKAREHFEGEYPNFNHSHTSFVMTLVDNYINEKGIVL